MQQPATVVVSQQPTLTVIQPENPQNLKHKKATLILGIMQIILGVAALIIGTVMQVNVSLSFWAKAYAPGISSGAVVLIGGILGLSSSFHLTNQCLVAANMTFAIISFCCALGESSIAGIAVNHYKTDKICSILTYYNWYTHQSSLRNYCVNFPNAKLGLALYSLVLVVMLVELVVSLTAAVYCGKTCCCGTPTRTGGVIIQQPQPYFARSPMATSEPPPSYVTTSKSHSSAVIDMNPIHKSGNTGVESGGIFNSGFGADFGSGS